LPTKRYVQTVESGVAVLVLRNGSRAEDRLRVPGDGVGPRRGHGGGAADTCRAADLIPGVVEMPGTGAVRAAAVGRNGERCGAYRADTLNRQRSRRRVRMWYRQSVEDLAPQAKFCSYIVVVRP
jgi:hypothetical protein